MMRNKYFDIIKGILILSVVVAHFDRSVIHDVIFLFHMPLFFILSGYFLNDKKIKDYSYLISRAKSLCIPYAVYLVLDWIIRGEYSIKSIGAMIWGGRAFPGTYWYITCFIAALFMIAFLQRRFSEKSAKCIILVGGGIAVIESHLSEFIPLLKFPGVPWNIDVALIAVVYLSIGFYYKDLIKKVLVDDSKKIDITAFVAIVLLIIFCITNYCGGTMWYYFDMKPVYYKELFLAIIVPCGFGLVLARIVYWFSKIRVLRFIERFFAYLGRITLPIMFMHVPLNTWKEQLEYGRTVYTLIGVGVPVLFTLLFHRYKIMRTLFGLPNLSNR